MSVAAGIAQPGRVAAAGVIARNSSAGSATPPTAASTGSVAARRSRSSPTTSSRLISSPTTKKNTAISPSLTQWRRSRSQRRRRSTWCARRTRSRRGRCWPTRAPTTAADEQHDAAGRLVVQELRQRARTLHGARQVDARRALVHGGGAAAVCVVTLPESAISLAERGLDDETPPGQAFLPHGARGTRTPDLLGAIQALSQLSYSPGNPTV